MFSLLNPLFVTQKNLITSLYIALGADNIKSVDSCMSRIRLTVHDTSKVADDSSFLNLKAKGVVREGDAVHLIYGQNSPVMAVQLKNAASIMDNEVISDLMKIFQKTKYIINIAKVQDGVKVFFHPAPHITQDAVMQFQKKHKIHSTLKNDVMEFKADEEFARQLQNTVLYWDLVQSNFILSRAGEVLDVRQNNYDIILTLKNPVDIDGWEQQGVYAEYSTINPSELVIQDCNEEFCNTFFEYCDFLKK